MLSLKHCIYPMKVPKHEIAIAGEPSVVLCEATANSIVSLFVAVCGIVGGRWLPVY